MNLSFLSMASAMMRASCVEPSQLAKYISELEVKVHSSHHVCVGFDFLPLKACSMCLGTLANTWVPSMASI
jgi:hypothetical protein